MVITTDGIYNGIIMVIKVNQGWFIIIIFPIKAQQKNMIIVRNIMDYIIPHSLPSIRKKKKRNRQLQKHIVFHQTGVNIMVLQYFLEVFPYFLLWRPQIFTWGVPLNTPDRHSIRKTDGIPLSIFSPTKEWLEWSPAYHPGWWLGHPSEKY